MSHDHYKKPVQGLEFVDVYRVLQLFGVTDPCLQHAVKKMLCAGKRGAKPMAQDVQEAIDTLERWKQMLAEDGKALMRDDFGQKNQLAPGLEPASQIDDESPRQQAIAQNGNDGAAYDFSDMQLQG